MLESQDAAYNHRLCDGSGTAASLTDEQGSLLELQQDTSAP